MPGESPARSRYKGVKWRERGRVHAPGGGRRIGFVGLDARDPRGVLYEAQEPVLDLGLPGAFDDCGPWVIKDGAVYRMGYSMRSKAQIGYRIGYAESVDSSNRTRKDGEAGIQPSESGWDSEMICYPCIVDAHGSRYLFYNGNRRGLTGFGCAVLDS